MVVTHVGAAPGNDRHFAESPVFRLASRDVHYGPRAFYPGRFGPPIPAWAMEYRSESSCWLPCFIFRMALGLLLFQRLYQLPECLT